MWSPSEDAAPSLFGCVSAERLVVAGRAAEAARRTVTGHAVRLQGDLKQAAGSYRESPTLFGETRDKWVATECIEGLALIASAQGRSDWAARLLLVAEAARETFGTTSPRPEAGDQEHFWAAIRERPEGTAFAAAWAEGRAMTLEQAVEYALAPEGQTARKAPTVER
jgi:hypothetical protein